MKFEQVQKLQPQLVDRFQAILEQDRLSHAYLFTGDFGSFEMAQLCNGCPTGQSNHQNGSDPGFDPAFFSVRLRRIQASLYHLRCRPDACQCGQFPPQGD